MDALRPMLHRHALDILPMVVRFLILLYAVLAVAHYLLMDESIRMLMTGLALATLAYLVAINYSLGTELVEDNAELILFSILFFAGVNTAAHLIVTQEVRHTTNFVFLIAVCGYILPGRTAFYMAVAGALLSWVLIVVFAIGWDTDATHFSFELGMGALFGYFLHVLRRNQLSQIEDMERTVEKLDDSRDRIRSGESLLQLLIDNIPAGVMVRDSRTRLLYANRFAREALDISDNDIPGLRLDENTMRICDADGNPLPREQSPVFRVLQTGEPQMGRMLGFRFSDDMLMWAVVNALPLPVEGIDEPVVVVAFADITDRRQIEIQLRESESRANAVLSSVVEAVIQVDASEKITLFNPAAQALTGYSESEALGQPLTEILKYQDHSNQAVAEELQYRSGTVTSKQGMATDVEVLEADLPTSLLSGRVLTIRDVSQQNRIEQERAIMDKMNSVGVLAAGIAHDFNNLLTAVYGNITLATGHLDDRELASSYLEKSSESILLATHLTKQLLTFASGSDPVRDVVNIETLVRESTQFTLSGSRVSVRFDVAEDVLPVEIDSGQVQQAISNIVLNAKQAMGDEGEISISIANELSESEDIPPFVKVVFSDNGIGMEPEMVSRIFDPYFTTKSEGSGLGLATTHSIVIKHGGSISVDSEPGEGSSFAILLPAVLEASEEPTQTEEDDIDTGSLRVLVMDDEKVVLNTIVRLLEFLGHDATPTLEGQSAIDAYRQQLEAGEAFDLVIVDLTVAGGMGGREAAAEILKLNPDARVVVSSGYSAGAEMSRYREHGFTGRLEKPFRSADLKQLLAEIFPASAGS